MSVRFGAGALGQQGSTYYVKNLLADKGLSAFLFFFFLLIKK